MKTIRIMAATVLALFAFGLAGSAPAYGQASGGSPCAPGGPNNQNPQYPPRDCGVAADRSQVAPGGKLTLTGQCPAGATGVDFRLIPGNVDLGSATPDANGNYTKEVTIPVSTRPGNYQIQATCTGVLGAGVVRNVAITVVGAAALPRTGSSSTLPLGAAGVGLVLVGGLAVLAVRRRRSAPAA